MPKTVIFAFKSHDYSEQYPWCGVCCQWTLDVCAIAFSRVPLETLADFIDDSSDVCEITITGCSEKAFECSLKRLPDDTIHFNAVYDKTTSFSMQWVDCKEAFLKLLAAWPKLAPVDE